MAVEARHLNLFLPQLIHNREIITNPIDSSINLYNVSDILLPAAPSLQYNSLIADLLIPHETAAIKSDSTITSYNNNVHVSRKRSREDSVHCSTLSFLSEDISLHVQQQYDVDNLVFKHMERVRMELQEKRTRQARMLMELIEEGMMKKLKAKEEEIEKIGRLNFALEERVKSLCIENQIWRELAQTNEATANALRRNLEQVLAQVWDNDWCGGAAVAATVEEAESSCGSNDEDPEGWRRIAGDAQDKEVTVACRARRLCRNCGKGESCVLIMPCRHLCLCAVCGSTLHTCPVCNSFKNASVHINMT